MPRFSDNAISDQMLEAQELIDKASGEDVMSKLGVYAYGPERLDHGRALLAALRERHALQRKEYGEQFTATDELHVKIDAAHSAYALDRKLAKLALTGNAAHLHALGLDVPVRRSLSGWISGANLFYDGALGNDDVLEALGQYNLTREKLEADQALVAAAEAANTVQEKEKGEAVAATAARDEAIDALEDWMRELKVLLDIVES